MVIRLYFCTVHSCHCSWAVNWDWTSQWWVVWCPRLRANISAFEPSSTTVLDVVVSAPQLLTDLVWSSECSSRSRHLLTLQSIRYFVPVQLKWLFSDASVSKIRRTLWWFFHLITGLPQRHKEWSNQGIERRFQCQCKWSVWKASGWNSKTL